MLMSPVQSQHAPTEAVSFSQLDGRFRALGCLGHGGTSSAFLAENSSGRKVVLKIGADNNQQANMERELHFLQTMNQPDEREGSSRHRAIVQLEFLVTKGSRLTGLMLQCVQGGSLEQEIRSKAAKRPREFFTERRIAWYVRQLAEALAFCHERDVYHSDLKSANILIDRNNGGRLVLCDFGYAITGSEAPRGFTAIYAAPELVEASRRRQFRGLSGAKLDSFSLGCVMFELLSCKRLFELSRICTLAQHVCDHSEDSFLDLPCIRLGWLTSGKAMGYSQSLKIVANWLLDPNPDTRCTPASVLEPLCRDIRSPLLADRILASQPPREGTNVTVDNVQLGMFVQRGSDWVDGEMDGGLGSIGVITQIDSDADYCYVGWPARGGFGQRPYRHRIGAEGKFELQVGPVAVRDFCAATPAAFDLRVDLATTKTSDVRRNGIVENATAGAVRIGTMINSRCVVVGIDASRRQVFAAPTMKLIVEPVPSEPLPFCERVTTPHPITYATPSNWTGNDTLVEIPEGPERQGIMERLFNSTGCLDSALFLVDRVERVQSAELWHSYMERHGEVAMQNWGMAREELCFHGTGHSDPESVLEGPDELESIYGNLRPIPEDIRKQRECRFETGVSGSEMFDNAVVVKKHAAAAHTTAYRKADGSLQIILSRVILGRPLEMGDDGDRHQGDRLGWVAKHSERRQGCVAVLKTSQILPLYIITYSRRDMHWERPTDYRPRANMGRNFWNRSPPEQEETTASHPEEPDPQEKARTEATDTTATTASTTASSSITDGTPKTSSPSKMCVICFENPVSYVNIPCGHVSLCEHCCTIESVVAMRHKCPECRATIHQTVRFYGRVVQDEE